MFGSVGFACVSGKVVRAPSCPLRAGGAALQNMFVVSFYAAQGEDNVSTNERPRALRRGKLAR